METKSLDNAYKQAAAIIQDDIKDKIKNGPTRAYKTGDLYRSVQATVVPIQKGESIQVGMNYYGEYVNNGTYAIEPPRRFIEAGLKQADRELEELLGDAAVKDIIIEFDKQVD